MVRLKRSKHPITGKRLGAMSIAPHWKTPELFEVKVPAEWGSNSIVITKKEARRLASALLKLSNQL
jgi:hypothetical protein